MYSIGLSMVTMWRVSREVDLLDQRRHASKTCRSRWAADQDQAVAGRRQLLEVRVQVELLDRGLEGGQQPDGKAHTAGGVQDVDAATSAVDGAGKIRRTPFDEQRPLVLAEHSLGHVGQQLPGNRLPDRSQISAHAQRRGQPRLQV